MRARFDAHVVKAASTPILSEQSFIPTRIREEAVMSQRTDVRRSVVAPSPTEAMEATTSFVNLGVSRPVADALRMRGIAEENHAPPVPMPDRIAVAHRLPPAEVEHCQQRLHGRMRVAVGMLELGAVGGRIGTLGLRRPAEHRDDVEECAVTQRVVHDVKARSAP